MVLKYGIYRKENFDIRERGTYYRHLYSQYDIRSVILAERQKVGTDPRNMQCIDSPYLSYGDKSDVFDYDIVEFVDGEIHMFGREDEKPVDHPAIKYHGLITDRNEVPKAFQSFDCYAQPWNPKTEPEAYYVVNGEAISCGLPIVAFNCGSNREFIDQ